MDLYKNKFEQGLTLLGGFGNDPDEQLTSAQYESLSPEQKKQFDLDKLAAKNRGIGELFFALSDAFGGRDIAGRAMQRRQLREKQELINREQKRKQKVQNIFKNTSLDQFGSNKDYYKNLGEQFINEGFYDQGIQFLQLGKPTGLEEIRKDIIDANKTEGKQFNTVKRGVENFEQLLDAAKSEGGVGSYGLMIKFIKQLDDSVVREGEVRTFGSFQGAFENLKNEVNKITGEGFTGKTRARIVNLAQDTARRLVEDWDAYKNSRSNTLYSPLGLSPEMVFAGYDLGVDDLQLDKVYTPDDFNFDFSGDDAAKDTDDLLDSYIDFSYTQNN